LLSIDLRKTTPSRGAFLAVQTLLPLPVEYQSAAKRARVGTSWNAPHGGVASAMRKRVDELHAR
jgi:hypothetical protein